MKRERVLFCLRVVVSLAMALLILEGATDAQTCNMQPGGVVLCSGNKSMSFWQDDCTPLSIAVKYQVSSDFMKTWGPISYLDVGSTSLDLTRDHQWEGLFRVKFGGNIFVLAPCYGRIKNTGNPLVLVMATTDCGSTWTPHEINLPIPDGLQFVRTSGCPELTVKVSEPGYFAMFGTHIYSDGVRQFGYGWVVSTRNGEDWEASLTGNGTMPTLCED